MKKAKLPKWYRRFPFAPGRKKPHILREGDAIKRIYGQEPNSIETFLHLSTDQLHVAEFHLEPGATFDPPDIHGGDEIYYMISGEVEVLDPDSGRIVTARAGDFVVIPEGVFHRTYNFSSEPAVILTGFAPDLIPGDYGLFVEYKGSQRAAFKWEEQES
jgi:gentisate 1,2-dioxygenase